MCGWCSETHQQSSVRRQSNLATSSWCRCRCRASWQVSCATACACNTPNAPAAPPSIGSRSCRQSPTPSRRGPLPPPPPPWAGRSARACPSRGPDGHFACCNMAMMSWWFPNTARSSGLGAVKAAFRSTRAPEPASTDPRLWWRQGGVRSSPRTSLSRDVLVCAFQKVFMRLRSLRIEGARPFWSVSARSTLQGVALLALRGRFAAASTSARRRSCSPATKSGRRDFCVVNIDARSAAVTNSARLFVDAQPPSADGRRSRPRLPPAGDLTRRGWRPRAPSPRRSPRDRCRA